MSDEKVYEFMKNSKNAMKQAEIIEGTGISKNEVTKALKKLKEEGKIESPKRCFYEAI